MTLTLHNYSVLNCVYRLSLDFMHTHDWSCKLSYYLRYSSKLVSAWVTVTIVVERLIIVALPLKVRSYICISRLSFTPRSN